MNQLLLTLYRIQKESGFAPKVDPSRQNAEKTTDFQRARQKVAVQVKHIRATLKERDELLGKKAGTKATVELSSNIRAQLKIVKADTADMQRLGQKRTEQLKKKAKKGGLSMEAQQEIEAMEEIVDLSWKHIQECEALEARRHGGDRLMGDEDDEVDGAVVVSSLPDVDDDAALGQKFALLKRQDRAIDAGLTEISEGLKVTKAMAEEMLREADLQTAMITQLEDQAESNLGDVEHLNKRLKGLLESVRGGNRFILDFICICILVILAGVIYKLVTQLQGE